MIAGPTSDKAPYQKLRVFGWEVTSGRFFSLFHLCVRFALRGLVKIPCFEFYTGPDHGK